MTATTPWGLILTPAEMRKRAGNMSAATEWRLAQKAFATTAAYDSAIASTLERISADIKDQLATAMKK